MSAVVVYLRAWLQLSLPSFVTQRPVLTFPAAVRAGFVPSDPVGSRGYSPRDIMAALKAYLGNTEHKNGVLADRNGDRVTNCGLARAVNEMLVVAPNDGSYLVRTQLGSYLIDTRHHDGSALVGTLPLFPCRRVRCVHDTAHKRWVAGLGVQDCGGTA
jgi:hypothetical protein|eukprot:SAG25_NODE_1_length_41698_cov_149.842015_32_plen_158_part_00